ncbi:MAG: hypothetical protein WAK16_05660 [Candidatus Cybelea sp.]
MGTTASSLHVLLPPSVEGLGVAEIGGAYEGLGYAPCPAADSEKRVVLSSGESNGYVSVYDSDNDKLDTGELKELAAKLSERLRTVALHTAVYDSDAFIFMLYHDGKQIDAGVDGELWTLDGLKVMSQATRAKRWRELFGSVGPAAAAGASVFAEDGLARWCAAAGLAPARATAITEDFSEPDNAEQTTLYFTRDAARATAPKPPAGMQAIKFFRSDDDQPYLAVYPAAWPAVAGERHLASWGAATSGPGFRGLRIRFDVEATGSVELASLAVVAWPFFSGQVTSLKGVASQTWSGLNEALEGGATIVKEAPDFELPATQSESRKQFLILPQVALRLGAASTVTLRPVLEPLDGAFAPLVLPPVRIAGVEPTWRPGAGAAPEVLAALNESSVATRWATLPDGLQASRTLAKSWFERWLASLSAPPGTTAAIFAESQMTRQLKTSKSNWSAPVEKLAQAKRWPQFFEAERDYRVVTIELTFPGEAFPAAGAVLCSAHRNPVKAGDEPQAAEPLNGAVWFINDAAIYERFGTSPAQQEQIFEQWLETTGAFQAWSTAATWFPASVEEQGLTLYERAIGTIEHPYRGAQLQQIAMHSNSWPARRLRFVARRLWLSDALYAGTNREALEKIATARRRGRLVAIALHDDASLSALQAALAPILPSHDDVLAWLEAETAKQPDRFQQAYALEQLAVAATMLAERDATPEKLNKAIEALEKARTLYSGREAPQGYASMERSRGIALMRLGERTGDIATLEAAVAAHREAVETLVPRGEAVTPGHRQAWVQSQIQLAAALTSLGSRNGNAAALEEAVRVLTECRDAGVPESEAAIWGAALDIRRGFAEMAIAKQRHDRTAGEAALALIESGMRVLRESPQRTLAEGYERLLQAASKTLAAL